MELLQKGQKISINIQKEDKLVEIIGEIVEVFDDRLDIELPPYFMRYIEYLDVGMPLTAKVFSKFGTIDFNTIIISSPLEDTFAIEMDYNALKFTAGEDLPTIEAIEQLIINRNNEEYTAKTFLISTEYIKIYSDLDLNEEENIDCKLILPEEFGTIKFKAIVAEKDIIYDNEYRIILYNMNEHDRQLLLYYMYLYGSKNEQEK